MTGAEIKKHRKRLGLTTDKLACKVGVTLSTIQKWERGASSPKKNNLIRLYAALDLGSPFRRKRTDKQRLADRKRRIELQMKLDSKVDKPNELGSWADLDDNDPDLLELRGMMA